VAVPSDVEARRAKAATDNYATDEALRQRQALLAFALPPPTPQPQLWDLFNWPPDAAVLDVGCGFGLWTRLAAERTAGGHVVGLDLSMAMLESLAATVPTVLPVRADGHRLPFADESFDVVLATWSLYHLPDKELALGDIVRVLRPGGRLIAATNESTAVPLVDDVMATSVEHVVGGRVEHWMEPLDFTLENGEEVLSSHFADVTRHVNETPYEVADASVLHGDACSLADPVMAETGMTREQFEHAVEHFDAAIATRLADGPLRFSRRTAFFVANAE